MTIPGQQGDVIASFEAGVDTLNLAYLGIQASSVTLNTYSNGTMVDINDGTNQTSIGVRTGSGPVITMSDIITA